MFEHGELNHCPYIYLISSKLFGNGCCVTVCRYGKTKDAFGWPEETEDLASTSAAATQTAAGTSNETDSVAVTPVQLTSLDRCVPLIIPFTLDFVVCNKSNKYW